MAQQSSVLGGVFTALADPTRRVVIHRLGAGPASVSELAAPFAMTLPSFMKHIRMLEDSGLIATSKTGRVRTCRLRRERLGLVDDWLRAERATWEARTDRLAELAAELSAAPTADPAT